MTAVCPAIQYGAMVHGGDGSILFIARLRGHHYGMPSAMAVKDLLTRQTDFYRTASDHCEFAHNNFVIERIALASKTSAVRSGNHADTTRRHLQHFCNVPVQIVHILSGRPECEFAVMAVLGQACMLF